MVIKSPIRGIGVAIAWHISAVLAIVGLMLASTFILVQSQSKTAQIAELELKIIELRTFQVETSSLLNQTSTFQINAEITPGINEIVSEESFSRFDYALRKTQDLAYSLDQLSVQHPEFSQQIDETISKSTQFAELVKMIATTSISATDNQVTGNDVALGRTLQAAEQQLSKLQADLTFFRAKVASEARLGAIIMMLFASALLALESFLVFLPSMSRVKRTNEDLNQMRLKAEERNAELAAMQSDLLTRNSELAESQERLQKLNHEQSMNIELLQMASKRFIDLFQGMPSICISTDLAGTVYEVNEEAAKQLGVNAFMLFEQDIVEQLVFGPDQEEWRQLMAQVLDDQRVMSYPTRLKRADGTPLLCLMSIVPLKGGEGQVSGFVVAASPVLQSESPSLNQPSFSEEVELEWAGTVVAAPTGEVRFSSFRFPAMASGIGAFESNHLYAFMSSWKWQDPDQIGSPYEAVMSGIALSQEFVIVPQESFDVLYCLSVFSLSATGVQAPSEIVIALQSVREASRVLKLEETDSAA